MQSVKYVLLTHLYTARTTGRHHAAHREQNADVIAGETDGGCSFDVLHSSSVGKK